MKKATLLQMWVEMIQENEYATLQYFKTFQGFIEAMKATMKRAYIDFWNWYPSLSF